MNPPDLIGKLGGIVGARHVLTGDAPTRRYRTGYRFGTGRVLAVVRPGTLAEQWRVLAACMAARAIVITQASNTGLTGARRPMATATTATWSSSAPRASGAST